MFKALYRVWLRCGLCGSRLKGQGLEVMVEEKVQQREYPDLMPLPKKSAAGIH
jgi:hypothetical protein